MNPIENFMVNAMNNITMRVINGIISCFDWWINIISKAAMDVLNFKIVNQGIMYAQGVALIILGTKVAYEAVSTYILYTNGDSNADPKGLLLKTFYSTAIICCIPWIMKAVFQLGNSITNDMSNISGIEYVNDAGEALKQSGAGNMILSILVVMVILFLIIISIQTFIRVAYFALLSVIGSFMALNIVSHNTALFRMWWKETIIVAVSQALQVFMVKASFYTVSYVGSENALEVLPALIGFLWVTYKTPSFLNQFKYSSGMSSAAGGVAQHVITSKIAKVVVK